MSTERLLDILPFAAIACFVAMITARAVFLNQRRVRVFVPTSNQTRVERAHEIANTIVFWTGAVLVAIYAWNPHPSWLPAWLNHTLINSTPARWLGAAMVTTAVVLYPVALAAMGNSWRVGIDRDAHADATSGRRPLATLITHGIFRFARNPIYVIVNALFIGFFLIHGSVAFLALAIAIALLFHLLILREERFLAERYGDAFADYRRRVGRYSPWI